MPVAQVALHESLSELLSIQHQVLTRTQAGQHGMTDAALRARLDAGRWQRVHPGVYAATTGPLTSAALRWAALLACGPGAVLSHATAAAMHGLRIPADQRIHVTVPAERHIVAPSGVVVHRSRRLAATSHPALAPPRTRIEPTVVDLIAGAGTLDRALSLIAQACQGRLTTAGRLQVEVAARRTLRWRSAVLTALADVTAGSHSLLELRYLRDVERRHGLPRGERQRAVRRGSRPEWTDVAYDAHATVVELDGRLGHDDPTEVWRDMRRDNAAVAAGEAPLRYGWADVTGRPCAVAGEVGAVLAARGWKGRLRKCGGSCGL